MKGIGHSSLRDIARLRDARRRRQSSWDRTGGNWDFQILPPGESHNMLDVEGAGVVTHVWVTIAAAGAKDELFLRNLILRMYWDGEQSPSVEVPIGDFFGMGHALIRDFISLPLSMQPQNGRGFNCFFPMPYSDGARITITNDGPDNVSHFYYYVDYEEHDAIEPDLGRFHACWRRENPTVADPQVKAEHGTPNLSGVGNYVILEAKGRGHYVGCNLNIDAPRPGWYGEGDDMIFIDGDEQPTLNGTGTEDYFNTAFCPSQVYSGPYSGITVQENTNFLGKTSLYRFHIEDPIMFEKSIRVTIEHGHGNDLENDYSSTAYWYQAEPHAPFNPLPDAEGRRPGIRSAS